MGADVLWLPCGIGQPFVTREVGPRVARQERVLSGARSTKLLALCGAHNDSLEQQRPGSLDFRVHKGSGQHSTATCRPAGACSGPGIALLSSRLPRRRRTAVALGSCP